MQTLQEFVQECNQVVEAKIAEGLRQNEEAALEAREQWQAMLLDVIETLPEPLRATAHLSQHALERIASGCGPKTGDYIEIDIEGKPTLLVYWTKNTLLSERFGVRMFPKVWVDDDGEEHIIYGSMYTYPEASIAEAVAMAYDTAMQEPYRPPKCVYPESESEPERDDIDVLLERYLNVQLDEIEKNAIADEAIARAYVDETINGKNAEMRKAQEILATATQRRAAAIATAQRKVVEARIGLTKAALYSSNAE